MYEADPPREVAKRLPTGWCLVGSEYFRFGPEQIHPLLKDIPEREFFYIASDAVAVSESGDLLVNTNTLAYDEDFVLENFSDEADEFSRVVSFGDFYVVDDSHMGIVNKDQLNKRFKRMHKHYANAENRVWAPVTDWAGNEADWAHIMEEQLPHTCNFITEEWSIFHYKAFESDDHEEDDDEADMDDDAGIDPTSDSDQPY
jgi:hypothetical protein